MLRAHQEQPPCCTVLTLSSFQPFQPFQGPSMRACVTSMFPGDAPCTTSPVLTLISLSSSRASIALLLLPCPSTTHCGTHAPVAKEGGSMSNSSAVTVRGAG